MKDVFIHESAVVDKTAKIGKGTKIWHFAQIRENAVIGEECIIAKNVYVCTNVRIGSRVKIQNNVSVYEGITIEEGVFIGPHVCFTNDTTPRAINPDGSLKSAMDWKKNKSLVKKGASIGANSTICPGITIGKWAMIGAGSVVTKDVPDFGLVYGNPAKLQGYVDKAGKKKNK